MINQADIAVSKVLSELGILSEESKEKVCIIQDIAKVIKLMGQSPLTVDGFDMLYDSTISELELIQEVGEFARTAKFYAEKMKGGTNGK